MAEYVSRVFVKFLDTVRLPYDDGIGPTIEAEGIGPWSELHDRHPGIEIFRAFTSVRPERIARLVAEAALCDPTYRPTNLLNCFVVTRPESADVRKIASEIASWPSVEFARIEPGAPRQAVTSPAGDPLTPLQSHLDPSPLGVGAESAWALPGGKGAGVRLGVVEAAFDPAFPDTIAPAELSGVSVATASALHATQAIGLVAGLENGQAGIGVAPALSELIVASVWRTAGATQADAADAILWCVDRLAFGDVLLLEVASGGHPIETEAFSFLVIRLATALGIVVVEPAGNGNHDLDAYDDPLLGHVLDRASGGAAFRDSGAILVAGSVVYQSGGSVPYRHYRKDNSSYGSRIDCFAQAENVVTTGATPGQNLSKIPGAFVDTSAASAIIAGVAVAVQGILSQPGASRLSGYHMRHLLSREAYGTLSSDFPVLPMGVMPNLANVLGEGLLVLPDVYVRDHVGDTGDPNPVHSSSSPDVFIRNDAIADPQGTFGEGTPAENEVALGSSVVAGGTNDVYVRVRNRGGADATNVRAEVFWSPPSSLVTGSDWTSIGKTAPGVTVPAGDVLTVLPKLGFGSVPAPGHYCLVALVCSDEDPAPVQADFLEWSRFLRFVRDNNNVAWRNFNVVAAAAAAAGADEEMAEMEFDAAGPPDDARRMRFEIGARLPEGSKLTLEGPAEFIRALGEATPLARPGRDGRLAIPLPTVGSRRMREVHFAAGAKIRLKLVVRLPKKRARSSPTLFARQVFDGQEVGRVTFRIVPPAKKAAKRRRPGR